MMSSYVIYNNLYFTTCTINHWEKLLRSDENKELITNCFSFFTKNERAVIYAFVIMDNHVHVLWETLEPHDIRDIVHSFQSYTSKKIKASIPHFLLSTYISTRSDRKIQIWKRSPLSVSIESPKFLKQKMNYIHNNPTKARLVEDGVDYRYCSLRSYVKGKCDFDFLTLWVG